MVEAGDAPAKDKSRRRPGLRIVSKAEVEAFTRELANLLAAGVPLSRALSILSREASRPAAKALWATIHDQVAGGQSLADALRSHPKHFPPITVAMVRAGEMGGFLDLVLDQIAAFRSREQDLMGKVKAALVYPAVLAVLATGILGFLLTYFIPRFSLMFLEFGGSLPTLTRAIVAASDLLLRFWYVIVLVIALIIVSCFMHSNEVRTAGRLLTDGAEGSAVGPGSKGGLLCAILPDAGDAVSGCPPWGSSGQEAIGNQVLADIRWQGDRSVSAAFVARSLQQCPALFRHRWWRW